MHFPSASPLLPLFSLTIPKKQNKKYKSPMFSEWRQAQMGWNSQKPTKQYGNDTTILSHHPYILCNFANCTPQNSLHAYCYWYPLNKQSTQYWYSLHSLLHKRQPISAMFSSNKSSQHNLHSNMPYTPSTVHVLYSFCIQDRPHLPHSVHCSHPKHNSLSMHINMHYTLSTTHASLLPSTTMTLL